jgi:hypothetical protein
MSLSIGTPEPRRRSAPRKPAAKKAAPKKIGRVSPNIAAPAARNQKAAPHLVDAERLFRRFEQLLPAGDHPFSQLRQDFGEWCDAGDIAPPSHIALAAWLRQAGLVSYRSGRAKVTVYSKSAARLAA